MNLDEKVRRFLKNQRDQWSDWNISEADGRFLYNVVRKHKYRMALEIGTSTGHSAIWIAWAMSKTRGKLLTVESSESRYQKAIRNFEKAGLLEYIDARLADAHQLVKELKGSFDFVFSDADKEWYKDYFVVLEPKLKVGGCFTAHNVSWSHNRGVREFLEFIQRLPHFETRIERGGGEGISISYKRALRQMDSE